MAVSLDYRQLRAAGVYTFETDTTQSVPVEVSALRLLVGFDPNVPFNTPLYLENEKMVQSLFGDIDDKLERRGAFMNRMARTMVQVDPIFAISLLPATDTDYSGYSAFGLNASTPNPSQIASHGASDGDARAEATKKKYRPSDHFIQNKHGYNVGIASFPYLFDRSRFWKPEPENVLRLAQAGTGAGVGNIASAPLFTFANTSSKDISIAVFRANDLPAYDVMARDWYGGDNKIPYPWIRPTDRMSDFFVQVVAIDGSWSEYDSYASDPHWSRFFTPDGLRRSALNNFLSSDSVRLIGTWVGSIIPDFKDKTGAVEYIQDKVNASNKITGLLCSVNKDGLSSQYLDYDNNGSHMFFDDISGGKVTRNKVIDLIGHTIHKDTREVTFLSHSTKIPNDVKLIDHIGDARYFGGLNTIVFPDLSVADSFNKFFGDVEGETIDGVKKVSDLIASIEKELTSLRDGMYKNVGGKTSPITLTWTNATSEDGRKRSNVIFEIPAEAKKVTAGQLTAVAGGIAINADLPAGWDKSKELAYFVEQDANGVVIRKGANVVSTLPAKASDVDDLIAGITQYFEVSRMFVAENTLFILQLLKKATTANEFLSILYKAKTIVSGLPTRIASLPAVKELSETLDELLDGMTSTFERSTAPKISTETYLYNINKGDGVTVLGREDNYGFTETNPSLKTKYESAVAPTIPGITRVNSVRVVTLDTLKSLNAQAKASGIASELTLSEEYIASLEAMARATNGKLQFKILSAGDPISIKEGSSSTGAESIGAIDFKGVIQATEDDKSSIESVKAYILRNILRFNRENSVGRDITNKILNFFSTNGKTMYISVQRSLSDPEVASTIRLTPLKGLIISNKHLPGFDKDGNPNSEKGVEKIYSMIEEEGILRGLTNPDLIDYRYIIDSMSFGLGRESFGKSYLARLAQKRGKCTALLNAPSMKQFELSSDPYFCDTFNTGRGVKPAFDTKYIPLGGNTEMTYTSGYSLPSEDNGGKYAAVFAPFLKYNDGGKTALVPPAADVSNAMMRKYKGGNPYAIIANLDGVLSNRFLTGVEYSFDNEDRGNLEQMGINPIISKNGQIMIYGNKTCYQTLRSYFNYLHVRELLNTIEIKVEEVLQKYVFEYDNSITRSQIVSDISTELAPLAQSGVVLTAPNIIMDDSNNSDQQLKIEGISVVDVEVVPALCNEKIVQQVKVLRNGNVVR